MSGKVAAFAAYGVKLVNDRWSWSAVTPRGEVVLALWKDQFDFKARPATYSNFGDPNLDGWRHRPGNKQRIKDLLHTREHGGGRFRVVIATAVDPDVEPREIETAYPQLGMIMQLVEFNEVTGEFKARIVEASNADRT